MEGVLEKKAVSFEKYETYKDSGEEWIGRIPEHWRLIRGNYVFKVIDERSKTGQEELLTVSEHKGVKPRSESTVNMFMAESYKGYKVCHPGDLVINSLWAWSRGLGFSTYHGIVSTAYSVYRPDTKFYDADFLNYLLRTDHYVGRYLIASKGIWISRLQLSDWAFLRIPILSPPKEEQTAIASFLDRKTEQIDKAIAIKEKQIELLKERRQILIHRAVTRGLDPNVKMKDSGVEWIGEVPEHWEVKRLKFLTHITTGARDTQDKVENGKFPFFVRSQTPERINSYSFDGEAVLTAGDGAGVGKVYHYFNGKFDFHQRVYKFSKFKSVKGRYFYYFLKSNFYRAALLGTAKSTVDSLRLPLIQDFEFCYPKAFSEQDKILEHIMLIESKVEKAVKVKSEEIQKLKEYKTSLINAAVTGKVKVF